MDGVPAAVGRARGGTAVAAFVATAAMACAVLAATRPAPLSCTFDSPEALAAAVLEGLAAGDRARLESLALSEDEFRRRVWPELPASRPERNVPFDYVWGDLHQKSRGHLAQTIGRHGGQRYELISIGFRGPATPYRSFVVARKTEVVVRRPDGAEETLRLFGSVLTDGSRYKLFSYVVD